MEMEKQSTISRTIASLVRSQLACCVDRSDFDPNGAGMGSRLLRPGGRVKAIQYVCAILIQKDAVKEALKVQTANVMGVRYSHSPLVAGVSRR
jgi:hypothetical protein